MELVLLVVTIMVLWQVVHLDTAIYGFHMDMPKCTICHKVILVIAWSVCYFKIMCIYIWRPTKVIPEMKSDIDQTMKLEYKVGFKCEKLNSWPDGSVG